jgi:hypothetical protein
MNGSNLTPADPGPGRQKLGKVVLFSIGEGGAAKAGELPGGEAAQGIVFAADNKTILVQFNVEKELAVYQVRDGGLVDTEARIKLDAGPVSIRTMPR